MSKLEKKVTSKILSLAEELNQKWWIKYGDDFLSEISNAENDL